MKFKIQAGAELDLLTKDEVRAELERFATNWRTEVARGIRYRRFSLYGDSTSGGVLSIGESGDQKAGPGTGFCWLLKRLSVSGAYDPAGGDELAFYHSSSENGSSLINAALPQVSDVEEFFGPGETLVFAGASLTASTRFWVTGQVLEAPEALAWKLIGA